MQQKGIQRYNPFSFEALSLEGAEVHFQQLCIGIVGNAPLFTCYTFQRIVMVQHQHPVRCTLNIRFDSVRAHLQSCIERTQRVLREVLAGSPVRIIYHRHSVLLLCDRDDV